MVKNLLGAALNLISAVVSRKKLPGVVIPDLDPNSSTESDSGDVVTSPGEDDIPLSIIDASGDSFKDKVTPELVHKIFIYTPLSEIKTHLPLILDAFEKRGLCDRIMICYMLGTLYVENPKFKPVSEKPSKYSDADGQAPYDFSKYDTMTKLGNTPEKDGDGEKFKGRGFVQLTGKANYEAMDKKLNLDGGLVDNPEAANEPHIASAIFAEYFLEREARIRAAAAKEDYVALRKIVNGGTIGLDDFTKAYQKALDIFKE